MLIFILFIVLLALKLTATAIVYSAGPLVSLTITLALIAIAYRIEPTAAKPQRQKAR